MKRNNKKGFTIVELVIVIAVIAILSAVLIPTFGGIIEKANNSARDQEAKNLFTNYLIECDANPAKGAYILVGEYYYLIDEDGQIDLEAETTGVENAIIVAHDAACADSTDAADDHCDVCNKVVAEDHVAASCPVCNPED